MTDNNRLAISLVVTMNNTSLVTSQPATMVNSTLITVSDANSALYSEDTDAQGTTAETENEQPAIYIMPVCLLILCFIICGGNLLVMFAIRNTQSVHRITKKFIINLAVADFLIGLNFLHRILFMFSLHWVDSYWSCSFHIFLGLQTYFTNAATLMGKWATHSIDWLIGLLADR